MANKDNPAGGRITGAIQSADFNAMVHEYVIPATDSSEYFLNDFVKTVGTAENGVPIVVKANAGDELRGIIVGFKPEFDSLNNTYRAPNTRRLVQVCDDPMVEFEIQATGTITNTDIGKQADFIVGAGNAATGLSGTQLDQSTISTSSAQLKILRIVDRVDNELGQFTKLYCMIFEHELEPTGAAGTMDHNLLNNLTYDTANHGSGYTGFQRGTTLSSSDPTANDDDTLNYVKGDFWLNTSTSRAFLCVDNSTGAAVWDQLEHTVDDIWERSGTTIEPANSGDDLDMGTGSVTAGSATINGKLTVTGSIDPTDLQLTPQGAAPASADGTVYYNSGTNRFQFREDGTWIDLGDTGLWERTGTSIFPETSGDDVLMDDNSKYLVGTNGAGELYGSAGDVTLENVYTPPLEGYWQLNNNGNDSSGNGRTLTFINGEPVDWVAGKLNQARKWDGLEYAERNSTTDLDFDYTDKFSTESWFYPTTATSTQTLLGKKDVGGNARGWAVFMRTDRRIEFRLTNTGTTNEIVVYGNTQLSLSGWHHVVTTYDGSATAAGVKIYVDNVLQSLTTVTDNLSATTINSIKFQLAALDGANLDIDLSGILDNIRVYSAELNAAQVAFVWNGGAGTESNIPAGTGKTLTINSGDAGLIFGTVGGPLSIDSAGGDVTMNSAAGDVSIDSGSGDVYIDSGNGIVDIDSGSGDVTLDSTSGNVTFTSQTGTLTFQTTSSGDVVFNPAGNIDASTSTIKNVVDPSAAQDAATKNFLETHPINGTWTSSGGNLTPTNGGDNVDIGTGGLKDNDVTTAIPLGSATATTLNTTAQNLVGAINEVNSLHSAAKQEVLTISSPGQTAFTLSQTPSGDDAFGLYLNGQLRTLTTDYTRSGTSLTWQDPGGLTLETTDELKAWYDFSAPVFLSPWQRSGTTVSLDNAGDTVQLDTSGGLEFGAGQNVVGISTDSDQSSEVDTLLITEKAAKDFAKYKFLVAAADPKWNAPVSNITGNGTPYILLPQIMIREVGSQFNTSTGEFTMPDNGYIRWEGSLYLEDLDATHTWLLLEYGLDTGGGPSYTEILAFDPSSMRNTSGTGGNVGDLQVNFCFGKSANNAEKYTVRLTVFGTNPVVDIDSVRSYMFIKYEGDWATT